MSVDAKEILEINGFTKTSSIELPTKNKEAVDSISFFLISLSNANLKTASVIDKVRMGSIRLIVVVIRSAIAYSSVVRIFVYSGSIKNTNAFDAKLLIVNRAVSVINFLYLFISVLCY